MLNNRFGINILLIDMNSPTKWIIFALPFISSFPLRNTYTQNIFLLYENIYNKIYISHCPSGACLFTSDFVTTFNSWTVLTFFQPISVIEVLWFVLLYVCWYCLVYVLDFLIIHNQINHFTKSFQAWIQQFLWF